MIIWLYCNVQSLCASKHPFYIISFKSRKFKASHCAILILIKLPFKRSKLHQENWSFSWLFVNSNVDVILIPMISDHEWHTGGAEILQKKSAVKTRMFYW